MTTTLYKFANEENNYECVICLMEIENEDMIVNQLCSMVFHEHCFANINMTTKKCYQCKRPNVDKEFIQLRVNQDINELTFVKEIESNYYYYTDQETDKRLKELLARLGEELNDELWARLTGDGVQEDYMLWGALYNLDEEFARHVGDIICPDEDELEEIDYEDDSDYEENTSDLEMSDDSDYEDY